MKQRKHQQCRKPRINFPSQKICKQIVKNQPIQNNQQRKLQENKYLDALSIKIVFLGDGNSGKTSALISYTTNKFNCDYVPTVFDTYESIIQRKNSQVKLQLWDTAGQDEYKKLRSLSYPKTDVFFICFSMIDKRSFANSIRKWYVEAKENCPRAQIIFVGTKIDLKSQYEYNKKRVKSITSTQCQYLEKQNIQRKINSMGHRFFVCSAVTQEGLNQIFDVAIDKILQKKKSAKNQIIKKKDEIQCQLI